MGPVRGALFLAYVLLALFWWRTNNWTGSALAMVLVDSVLPISGLPGGRIRTTRRSPYRPRESCLGFGPSAG
ncbi:DUF3817 domain-containing protein [Pseudarthrobacter sp. AG30]|uniref:DUF3817 domain-containing protein n=1 Tax=unclassified Pseudarthrobacter TaxID=2647000 RepID=UPI0014028C40